MFCDFSGDLDGKESPAMQEMQFQFLSWDFLEKGEGNTPVFLPGEGNTPVFLPGEFHGQRGLVGYSPWGLEESDTAERLTLFKRSYELTSESYYISSNLGSNLFLLQIFKSRIKNYQ